MAEDKIIELDDNCLEKVNGGTDYDVNGPIQQYFGKTPTQLLEEISPMLEAMKKEGGTKQKAANTLENALKNGTVSITLLNAPSYINYVKVIREYANSHGYGWLADTISKMESDIL